MGNIFAPFARQNGGLVKFNDGAGAPINPVKFQGLLLDDIGQIYSIADGTPAFHVHGLPFDSGGRLCVSSEAVSYKDQGLAFTALGLVAMGDDAIDYYDQGVGFSVDSRLSQIGGGGPIGNWILKTAFWRDVGVWEDTAFWID